MKGFLYQRELGWFVKAANDMSEVIYLLHPKDAEMMESDFTDKFTRNVEFEIIHVDEVVKEYLSNKVPYAKLVNIIPDKSDREVKISAYQKMAENSWEGCDGCTEDDKYFYIKGYMAAMLGKEINNSESWGKETGY
jgi:hypothetical protein